MCIAAIPLKDNSGTVSQASLIMDLRWTWDFSSLAHWWEVNTGSGNGSVPSGNKPLPESMLPPIYVKSDGMIVHGHRGNDPQVTNTQRQITFEFYSFRSTDVKGNMHVKQNYITRIAWQ